MKRMLIAGAALLLVSVMNGQNDPTVASAATPATMAPAPSQAILERLKNELGLDEAQAAKAADLLLAADKETVDPRAMCETMMKRVDEAYDRNVSQLEASLTPEQAKKFADMKAQGLLKGACCSGSKGCGDAAGGKKEGCCAGAAAPSGKAVMAPRPTTPAKRTEQ